MNKKYILTPAEIRKEREADYFARCLLMPEKLIIKFVKETLKKEKLTLQELVNVISKKFDVETVHVTLRLKDLNLI